jgi:hypothetical protein
MERVPPRLCGGTERIVSYRTDELVQLGHDLRRLGTADNLEKIDGRGADENWYGGGTLVRGMVRQMPWHCEAASFRVFPLNLGRPERDQWSRRAGRLPIPPIPGRPNYAVRDAT